MEFVEVMGRIAQNHGPSAAVAAAVAILLVRFYWWRYANRKGKNLATREDYETLLEQLKITARETEGIKTELAQNSWLAQQKWQRCEAYFTDLLANLSRLKRSLLARSSYLIEAGAGYVKIHERSPQFQLQAVAGADAFRSVERMAGTAAVYLSDGTVRAVEQLAREAWHVEYDPAREQESVERILELTDKAYAKVLAEARSALAPSEKSILKGDA